MPESCTPMDQWTLGGILFALGVLYLAALWLLHRALWRDVSAKTRKPKTPFVPPGVGGGPAHTRIVARTDAEEAAVEKRRNAERADRGLMPL